MVTMVTNYDSYPLRPGGDLHYHLTQRNSFTEAETRFYAAEVILGLEHMHNRSIVYRDLKVFINTTIFCQVQNF